MHEARRGKKTSGLHMSSSSLHNDDDSSSVYWRGLLFSNLLFHTVIFMVCVCVSQLCYSGCTDRKNMCYLQNPKKQPLSSSFFSPIFQYICEFFVCLFFFKFLSFLSLVFVGKTFAVLKSYISKSTTQLCTKRPGLVP